MLTTKDPNNVVADTDKEGKVLPVTEDELREDRVATRATDDLIAELTAQATPIRKQISHVEAAASSAANEDLLAEAQTLVAKLRMELCRLVSLATHGAYTADDVSTWFKVTMRGGGKFPRLRGDTFNALAHITLVPVLPLRELFVDHLERDGGSYLDIMRAACGHLKQMEKEAGEDFGSRAWHCTSRQESKQALNEFQRHLGMLTLNNTGSYVTFMSYERAVAISRAIGLNPIQVGV